MLMPPVLSELDPLQKGEGSIDPLGLAGTYERLANQMLGNVTVRMTRIRFVTALAVGTAVCEVWDDDERASDGVSSPWQVFEWATVIAFAKARNAGSESLLRVAGSQKVQRALRAQYAISAKTYLKTPTVFGFGGIFRRFAVGTGVIGRDGHLEEAGHVLVRAWAGDHALAGFLDGAVQGDGRQFRERLRRVVRRGLEQGCLTSSDVPADVAQELAQRLDPSVLHAGRERDVLRSLVQVQAGEKEGAEFLSRELQRRGRVLEPVEEAGFLRPLAALAPHGLQATLQEIDAYEALCRPLTDTFAWIRYWAALRRGSSFARGDFEDQNRAASLLADVRAGLRRVREMERLLVADPVVRTLADRFENVRSAGELFDALIAHQQVIQKEKLPNGKRPWVEQANAAQGIVVRPTYVVEEAPDPGTPYVHEYRLPTLSRFLADLGVLS